jgi:PHD/YefM family antitoxin component YafN of YafNO toxin-antitoxin module
MTIEVATHPTGIATDAAGLVTEVERSASPLADAVAEVLPAALVSSAGDAERVAVPQVEHGERAATGPDVAVIAAALGSTAVSSVVRGIQCWFADRGSQVHRWLPNWFQPALRADVMPTVVTLTEFSNRRNKHVRDVIDTQSAVLISRHGKVVAAIVPLVEGAFEDTMYAAAARDIRASRLGDSDELTALLDNLTDQEIELLREAEDKVQAAASIGIDLPDGKVFERWLSARGDTER